MCKIHFEYVQSWFCSVYKHILFVFKDNNINNVYLIDFFTRHNKMNNKLTEMQIEIFSKFYSRQYGGRQVWEDLYDVLEKN